MSVLKYAFIAMLYSVSAWVHADNGTTLVCTANVEDWNVLNTPEWQEAKGLPVKNEAGCMVLFVSAKSDALQADGTNLMDRKLALVLRNSNNEHVVATSKAVLKDEDAYTHYDLTEVRWVKFPNQQSLLRTVFNASRYGAGFGSNVGLTHFFSVTQRKLQPIFSYEHSYDTAYSTMDDCREESVGKATYQYLRSGDASWPDFKITNTKYK